MSPDQFRGKFFPLVRPEKTGQFVQSRAERACRDVEDACGNPSSSFKYKKAIRRPFCSLRFSSAKQKAKNYKLDIDIMISLVISLAAAGSC
jgi:hypothetical protein